MKAVTACVTLLAIMLAAHHGRAADKVTKATKAPMVMTATWYGGTHDGRRMANGRIFRKNDRTVIASTKFPLGTKIEVKSLTTGRTLIGRVSDRGLFGRNHLDLSEAGAVWLGFREAGRTKLRVTVIN